ncbi:SUKH-4 family immunity protein [Streptomyces yokosukanensis]|nr:SUKH-4 family immunity protein [Streptomyces yokosukanensis]
MVTYAQAQERAEEWINGDVPVYQHREVRVREFELGFVVWGEDRAEGPRSDAGAQRLVIARDSGEATLWPGLPVGEVIRRYEEEYGRADGPRDTAPAPAAARMDLNQTSFLLTPPEWLQEAADKLGIGGDRRPQDGGGSAGAGAGGGASGVSGAGAGSGSGSGAGVSGVGAGAGAGAGVGPGIGASGGGVGVGTSPGGAGLAETQAGVPAGAPGASGVSGGVQGGSGATGGAQEVPGAPGASGVPGAPVPESAPPVEVPVGATPWSGTDTNADPGEDDRSVPLPATVFAPPLSDPAGEASRPPASTPDAKTALMSGGSQLPRTAVAPALDAASTPGAQGFPPGAPGGSPAPGGVPGAPGAAYAPGGSGVPGAPAAPGAPGAPQGSTPPPPPGAAPYGYPQPPAAPGTPPPGVPAYSPAPGAPAAPGAPQGSTPPPPPGAPTYGYPQGPAAPQDAPGYGYPQAPGGAPGAPQPPADADASARQLAPNAGDIADAATSKAAPPPKKARGGVGAPPPPPGVPGAPGARPGSAPMPPAPGAPAGGYVPTQLVSALGPQGQGGAGAPGGPVVPGGAEGVQAPGAPSAPGAPTPPPAPPGNVHHAATMLADPSLLGGGAPQQPGAPGAPGVPGAPGAQGGPGAPGMPTPPGVPMAPGAPGMPLAPGAPHAPGAQGGGHGAVHHAETMLAAPPVTGPGAPPPPPPPPPAPGALGAPGAPGMPPGAPQPMPPGAMPPPGGPVPGQPPAYGYPQQGQPTVGPGYQAVLRYRAQDGSEQQLIRRSAPGTPHPEWQIFHELRAMNVPPDQVLELHTELESCELPGAYCARMMREQWPQARITSIAPYGTDQASRQQGMRQLLAHQGELHQVADGPARPAPVRAPLPPVQAAPPVPPEGIGQELAAAFGPGIFRFEQQAVSRQGVPPIVAHTLVVAGLPVDLGPFFWAQAQPGRPVPTLAELAAERGVQPASDAGSYLVMGTDFGRAICVQYGTANIVAVPVEAGPGGAPVPPQFVNSGLPEFARCLALLGRMWRLRYGLNQEQAGRWTVDFQAQLAALDPAALGSPESWWSVLLEQMWDGLL